MTKQLSTNNDDFCMREKYYSFNTQVHRIFPHLINSLIKIPEAGFI